MHTQEKYRGPSPSSLYDPQMLECSQGGTSEMSPPTAGLIANHIGHETKEMKQLLVCEQVIHSPNSLCSCQQQSS